MSGPSLFRDGQRVTTDRTLARDLRHSLIAQGVCPHDPTLEELIQVLFASGVTLSDRIEAIQFTGSAGKFLIERDENGEHVRIGEKR